MQTPLLGCQQVGTHAIILNYKRCQRELRECNDAAQAHS